MSKIVTLLTIALIVIVLVAMVSAPNDTDSNFSAIRYENPRDLPHPGPFTELTHPV